MFVGDTLSHFACQASLKFLSGLGLHTGTATTWDAPEFVPLYKFAGGAAASGRPKHILRNVNTQRGRNRYPDTNFLFTLAEFSTGANVPCP